jgi:inorganic pyrophosphatase
VSENVNYYRAHPWHGLSIGKSAPEIVNCYIEMSSTDTIKYELDKETGLLKVDRPQQYSSICPTLYGFLPRTYSGFLTANYCMEKTGLDGIVGDGDPVDIAILTEKTIPRGDILLRAVPIGGFRMIDGNEADDKIIGVLVDDLVYGNITDIADCPKKLIERLRHYFLTYKDCPGEKESKVYISHLFESTEALKIIELGLQDYKNKFV